VLVDCHIHKLFFGTPIRRENAAALFSATLSITKSNDFVMFSLDGEDSKL
jgi:hypothetical protein